MAKDRNSMTLHQEQRAVHKASLAALKVDSRFALPLLGKLEELSDELFQAADHEFNYGEPVEAQKRIATMNTFMELLNELLVQANNKK
jgi:hypothetical protein